MKQKKEIIRFGNWTVTTEGILWDKDDSEAYFIDKTRLWETRADDKSKWSWLLQLAEKAWLNELDLYQFNPAFFFAQDYFKNLKPKGCEEISTWKTLENQKRLSELPNIAHMLMP